MRNPGGGPDHSPMLLLLFPGMDMTEARSPELRAPFSRLAAVVTVAKNKARHPTTNAQERVGPVAAKVYLGYAPPT